MRRFPWFIALALILACTAKTYTVRDDPFALPGEKPSSRPGVTHLVLPGDTWMSLAEDYYGRERKTRDLRRANPRLDDVLSPGQEIFIPMNSGERAAFEQRAQARIPYNAGLELAREGAYPDAILRFKEAVRLDENFAAAHYNLGLVYSRAGRRESAAKSLADAVSLRPQRANYHYAHGAALLELQRPRQAERSFQRALRRDADHLPSLWAMARLLDDRGRGRQAKKYWRRILALDPDGARGEAARHRLEGSP